MYGELPRDIGQLRSLDALDLSRNQFFGNIPSSLSQVHELSYLNLSFNNFSGRIPTGTQLQSFTASSYEGNPLLYGLPLTHTPSIVVENEEDEKYGHDNFWISYYMGMGIGFAVGFWGTCGAIFLNRRCRHLLFASLSLSKDWICVTVVVLFRKLKRFYAHQRP
ncbi:receptor-like protein EIX2 [Rutidosis leptorrhynchoides]|uniref:receptor-like protein EIX2 n=1 Tax=Rutidosis leptorrhynchoides TaxID=125765 RepID=UPI003A990280